jgi:hypothetical protein
MSDRSMTFLIDTDGNVRIANVEGFGDSCLDATKLLEQRLGQVDASSRKTTDELYASSDHTIGIEL